MRSVLLVDDHAIARMGLRKLLLQVPSLAVGDEADTGAAAIALVRERPFDLAFLDLSLPDRSGFRVLQRMRVERPEMRVMIVSAHVDETYVTRAFAAGASGYLMKGSTAIDMLGAVHKVLRGDTGVVSRLDSVAPMRETEPPPHAGLTSQEFEVFMQMASGMTRLQIARRNSVAVTTIAAQRATILSKMRLRSGSELAYYAVKHRLIP